MSEIITVKAKYQPTDQWFLPKDCAKVVSIKIDGKKIKWGMIKAFEILEYIEDAKIVEVMYKIKKDATTIKGKGKNRKKA